MTVRPILPWPDKRLRTSADPVEAITDDIRAIWQDMIDTMEAMPGVGLAAPQIGIGLQLAVVDASDERGRAIRLANPEIIEVSPETSEHPEASPNLPGVSAKITRPARVDVAFTDAMGLRVRQEFVGLWATSVQHQIDHLNGRMFFDNLSRTKREMLLKRARKVAR
ncbi:MAG: peptide deformylase [Alphaproteobacteria bacterium]|nr:peptide deformylase [Alphaproteobacteria bacterium]NNF72750.1 peptide deformylase [Paracoccaceae bacterium]